MSTITKSSLTGATVEYYEKRLLTQPEFRNDLLKYGQKGQIPQGNSDVIHWTRVDRFGRPQSVTDGTDLSSERTPTISTVQGQLELFGDFVKITPYGDKLRIFSMIDKSYDEFIVQTAREANLRQQQYMIAAYTSGSSIFPGAKIMYGSGAETAATAGPLTLTDIENAVSFVEANNGPGTIRCITNNQGKTDLLQNTAFRELLQGGDLKSLKENNLPMWGGAMIGYNADPFRCSAAAETTYSATGNLFVTWVFSEGAFGTVQLMGKGGLRPSFKTQDISVIGNLVTIGYFIPYIGGVLNAGWIVGIVHKGTRNLSVSGFTS